RDAADLESAVGGLEPLRRGRAARRAARARVARGEGRAAALPARGARPARLQRNLRRRAHAHRCHRELHGGAGGDGGPRPAPAASRQHERAVDLEPSRKRSAPPNLRGDAMTLAVEIEALLFVSDQPLAMERLREVLQPAPQKEIQAALDELAASYEA